MHAQANPHLRLGNRTRHGVAVLLASKRMSEVLDAVQHLGMRCCLPTAKWRL